jgi:eukaryotic-like serine/threonine-protein kinase
MKTCPQCGRIYEGPVEACTEDRMPLIDDAAAALDPLLGRLLADRYRLVQKIGQGGMGSIYKALQTKMERICAIKLLTALSHDNEAALARFNREAKMASRIDNRHAITIYDYGEAEGGVPYLAMEFVDGKPLSTVLAEEGYLPVERVVAIINQIAEALTAAHSLGIVHRDLKPDNVMITHKGDTADYVKVLDFGIAKTVIEDSNEKLTMDGFVLGTPVYMSPEQLSGEKLDARSDIYSLAIIAYEMLSGRLPFEGENPQAIMIKRITVDPIQLRMVAPEVSDSVNRVVMDGLARHRESRTPSADAFARALSDAHLTGTQPLAPRPTAGAQPPVPATTPYSDDTREWASYETTLPPDGSSPRGEQPGPEGFGQTLAIGKPTSDLQHQESASDSSSSRKTVPFNPASPQTALYDAPARPGTQQATIAPESAVEHNKVAPPRPMKPAPAPPSKVVESEPARRRWIWYAAGAAVVVVIGVLLMTMLGGSGYAVVVKGAAPNSEVFINGARRGVTAQDGTMRVTGLDEGDAQVRVARDGYLEFTSTVSGKKGDERVVEARMLPLEIDRKGEMVLISAGEFVMGDNKHEGDAKPERTMSLPAFYIDKYEVTNAQYKAFCDATNREPPDNPKWNPTYFQDNPDHPVLGVTRDEAREYARWAGKRLPSEEEWEKAAGWDPAAKAKRQWPWGNNKDEKLANVNTDGPASVKDFSGDRSAYGVYGMAGNAYEWVDSYYQAYPDNTTPNKDFGTKFSVVRGGNFQIENLEEALTTYRNYLPATLLPGENTTAVGFRCAISADAAQTTGK